jgi:hypothetical protein
MRDLGWGSLEEDYDYVEAAQESRRLHELRGLVIGQVAKIEAMLLFISTQIRERFASDRLQRRRGQHGAGNALNDVEALLYALGVGSELGDHIKRIRRTISRRNSIVHATIHIGVAYVEFNDSRSAVISLLLDNDPTRHSKPAIEEDEDVGTDEVDEVQLERQLTEAYDALDRCIDIWVRVESAISKPAQGCHSSFFEPKSSEDVP